MTSSSHSLVQPPWAPAFITTAPPTVPGMPTAHSRPPRPARAARRARVGIGSPAWASIRPVAPSSWLPWSRRWQRVRPARPWSLISRLEPAPITCRGRPWCRAQRARPITWSLASGSQNHWAAPPTFQVVKSAKLTAVRSPGGSPAPSSASRAAVSMAQAARARGLCRSSSCCKRFQSPLTSPAPMASTRSPPTVLSTT